MITIDELVQKKVTELLNLYRPFFYHKNSKSTEAKIIKCSIITCDEILNDGKMIYCGNGTDDGNYKFWVKVKNNLKSKLNDNTTK